MFSGEIIESQGKQFFLTVMVDITTQMALTRKVEIQRKRLENIIEGTQLGTWEWNVKTGQTIFNERWAAIAGYTYRNSHP
ncbi:MAG: hypothetical protein MZV63_30800 [Marinilabiliales bacterium]|nr:hypothetical protein [Marinilabiliales bacterium]